MGTTTVSSVAKTAANVSGAFDWQALMVDILGVLISDGLPIALTWLQQQASTPTEVHDAIPDPKTDAAVADAIGADIAAGLVGTK